VSYLTLFHDFFQLSKILSLPFSSEGKNSSYLRFIQNSSPGEINKKHQTQMISLEVKILAEN